MLYRLISFLGKTLNAISHLGTKQSIRCGGPFLGKICNSAASMLECDNRHRGYNIWFKRRRL